MQVYVHPCPTKNIGDEFNHWFWQEIFDEDFRCYSDDILLVGIGTVLNDKLPKASITHVLGSGVGYGNGGKVDPSRWNIHFVRGKLSANALGLGEQMAISDPGILISRLRPQEVVHQYPISFMPHIGIDSERYRRFIEEVIGWHYISPSDEEDKILKEIVASSKLITSAMHGAIIADSYRVPWLAVNTSPEILPFKWQDWFSSLNIDAHLTQLPAYWNQIRPGLKSKAINFVKEKQLKSQLLKLLKKGHFQLSDAQPLVSKQEQLLDKLAQVKPLIFSEEHRIGDAIHRDGSLSEEF